MTLPRGITRSLGPTEARTHLRPIRDSHLCSNCHSYSLASICPYTLDWIPVQLNLPYAHLRYLFEGYRPSQTNTVTRSMPGGRFRSRIHVSGIHFQGGISLMPSSRAFRSVPMAPTYPTQKDEHTQCNHSVKVYGVFSSTSQVTVSSLLFQFH